jgi:hypothetical protein
VWVPRKIYLSAHLWLFVVQFLVASIGRIIERLYLYVTELLEFWAGVDVNKLR